MMIPLRTPLSKMASWRPALVRQSRPLFVVAVTAVSANSAVAGWNTAPETIEEHPAWIYTPSTAMPNGKHPFLIVLHGCAQTHTEIKEVGNLVPTAEANGVVVAVPFVGSKFFGTPQQKCWDYDGALDAKGHMVELVNLADTLKARTALNIDPNHVYIVGYLREPQWRWQSVARRRTCLPASALLPAHPSVAHRAAHWLTLQQFHRVMSPTRLASANRLPAARCPTLPRK